MPIEARINKVWAAKWLIMGSVLFGFGLLCIYDATVKYPRDQERYAEYVKYEEIGDSSGRNSGWARYAEEQGWPVDPPKDHSDLDILTQWIMLAIAWPLGFAALGMVFWFRGRKIAATDDALISHRGERIPYTAITGIDKERWDKGIAFVLWEDDNGQEKRTKIDDFVFRDAWRILDHVEDQTGLGEPVPG